MLQNTIKAAQQGHQNHVYFSCASSGYYSNLKPYDFVTNFISCTKPGRTARHATVQQRKQTPELTSTIPPRVRGRVPPGPTNTTRSGKVTPPAGTVRTTNSHPGRQFPCAGEALSARTGRAEPTSAARGRTAGPTGSVSLPGWVPRRHLTRT